MWKEWQSKVQAQQNQVDMLTREVDVANREYRLRAAAFYADAGNRLRNAVAWDKEDTQFKEQMADKQKKLEEAKKQLEELQEPGSQSGRPCLHARVSRTQPCNSSLPAHWLGGFFAAHPFYLRATNSERPSFECAAEGKIAPPPKLLFLKQRLPQPPQLFQMMPPMHPVKFPPLLCA